MLVSPSSSIICYVCGGYFSIGLQQLGMPVNNIVATKTSEEATTSSETVKQEEIEDCSSMLANVGDDQQNDPDEEIVLVPSQSVGVQISRVPIATNSRAVSNLQVNNKAEAPGKLTNQMATANTDTVKEEENSDNFIIRVERSSSPTPLPKRRASLKRKNTEIESEIEKLKKQFHRRYSLVTKNLPFLQDDYVHPSLNELVRPAVLSLEMQQIMQLANEFATNFAEKYLNVKLSKLLSYTDDQPDIVIPSESHKPPYKDCITFPWEPVIKDESQNFKLIWSQTIVTENGLSKIYLNPKFCEIRDLLKLHVLYSSLIHELLHAFSVFKRFSGQHFPNFEENEEKLINSIEGLDARAADFSLNPFIS